MMCEYQKQFTGGSEGGLWAIPAVCIGCWCDCQDEVCWNVKKSDEKLRFRVTCYRPIDRATYNALDNTCDIELEVTVFVCVIVPCDSEGALPYKPPVFHELRVNCDLCEGARNSAFSLKYIETSCDGNPNQSQAEDLLPRQGGHLIACPCTEDITKKIGGYHEPQP
jgi:hypothetical protein